MGGGSKLNIKRVSTELRKGFTLAEVLITLAIIGVVAAITMPTVIKNFKVKQTVVHLKRDYKIISNAVLMAINQNGEIANWGLTGDNPESTTQLADILKPYFKILKDCGTATGEECVYQDYFRYLVGIKGYNNDHKFSSEKYYKILIADGTSVMFRAKTSCTLTSTAPCAEIYVDINNKKAPNTLGKDIFYFNVYTNGQTTPAGHNIDPNGNNSNRCNPTSNGWFCTAWVVFNENMDYLDCADQLSWKGKTSCK